MDMAGLCGGMLFHLSTFSFRLPGFILFKSMHKFKWLNLAFAVLLFGSCGKSLPELNGVDEQLWKDDKNGCAQQRSSMIASLKTEKDKLLALDEMQIVTLLGKPDRNELFTRNQKFYAYFLEPSQECKGDSFKTALKLVIRFNAMGLAKEVAVE